MPLTEWTDLLARLERDPESDILAAMLTDELMDARGMARNEADKYVATARGVAQTALDIAFVASVIRAKGPAYHWLMSHVWDAIALPDTTPITLFIVGGDGPARVGIPMEHASGARAFVGQPVALPATWARKWVKASALPVDPLPAPTRGRRRHPKGGAHAPS